MTLRAQWNRGVGHPPKSATDLLIDGIRQGILRAVSVAISVTGDAFQVLATFVASVTVGTADADLTETFTMTPDLVVTP